MEGRGVQNTLALFDSASPAQVTTRSITGIGFARTVRGIDVRPVSGEVYIVSAATGAAANSGLELYTLEVNTGRATLIGATAAALAGAADVPTGLRLQPCARLRRADRPRAVRQHERRERAARS